MKLVVTLVFFALLAVAQKIAALEDISPQAQFLMLTDEAKANLIKLANKDPLKSLINDEPVPIHYEEALIHEKEKLINEKEALIIEEEAVLHKVEALINEQEELLNEKEDLIQLEEDLLPDNENAIVLNMMISDEAEKNLKKLKGFLKKPDEQQKETTEPPSTSSTHS